MVQDCPSAAQVIGVLELVYKTYHYSPKSRRELYELWAELDVAVYLQFIVAYWLMIMKTYSVTDQKREMKILPSYFVNQ